MENETDSDNGGETNGKQMEIHAGDIAVIIGYFILVMIFGIVVCTVCWYR